MSQLTQGTNSIAVAIVHVSSATATCDFDISLRLLKDSNVNPRYWDVTAISNVGTAAEVIDLDPSTRIRVPKSAYSSITLSFQNTVAEFFNRYCFITSPDTPSEDPLDWLI